MNQLRVVSGAVVTKRAVYHRMQHWQRETCSKSVRRTVLRLPCMNRFLLELASQVGIWISIFVAVFVPVFVASSTRKEPYLKRVAKKYSIPPLDLR